MLKEEELKNIQGGISLSVGLAIGGVITFLIGLFDGFVRPYNCRQEEFMLTKEELKLIQGGAIAASMITAVIRGINTILDLGRSLGTVIRRIQTNNMC